MLFTDLSDLDALYPTFARFFAASKHTWARFRGLLFWEGGGEMLSEAESSLTEGKT